MTRRRVLLARLLAVGADVVQLGLWPLFSEGAVSPFDDALDVVLGGLMVWLLGWHWAFAPAFVAELVPGVSLVPTWTMAVFLATRGKGEVLPAPVVDASPAQRRSGDDR
jgi:hypothetical protein